MQGTACAQLQRACQSTEWNNAGNASAARVQMLCGLGGNFYLLQLFLHHWDNNAGTVGLQPCVICAATANKSCRRNGYFLKLSRSLLAVSPFLPEFQAPVGSGKSIIAVKWALSKHPCGGTTPVHPLPRVWGWLRAPAAPALKSGCAYTVSGWYLIICLYMCTEHCDMRPDCMGLLTDWAQPLQDDLNNESLPHKCSYHTSSIDSFIPRQHGDNRDRTRRMISAAGLSFSRFQRPIMMQRCCTNSRVWTQIWLTAVFFCVLTFLTRLLDFTQLLIFLQHQPHFIKFRVNQNQTSGLTSVTLLWKLSLLKNSVSVLQLLFFVCVDIIVERGQKHSETAVTLHVCSTRNPPACLTHGSGQGGSAGVVSLAFALVWINKSQVIR